VLAGNAGNTLELEDTFIPYLRRKLCLSELDQGYKYMNGTRTISRFPRTTRTFVINCKENQLMFYLLQFKVKSEVNAIGTAIDINNAHERLGHIGEDILCKTMKYYGIKLTGKLEACSSCIQAKTIVNNIKSKPK